MMLKKKKIFIGVLGASVLLIAGSNLAINYMIDRQKINDQLSEIIEKKTGRKVHLNHLSLQLVPWPEIKASDIALENIKDGKADYFIHARKFSAKINLLSLLKKNINIHALELSNVKLNLEENQEGIKNWEFHPYKKSDILSEKNKKKNKKKWTVNFRTINFSHVQTCYDNFRNNKHAHFLLKTVDIDQFEGNKIRFEINGHNHQANFSLSGRINHADALLLHRNVVSSSPVKFQMVLTEYFQNQNVGNIHVNGTVKDSINLKNFSISARGAILNLQNLNLLFPHANLPLVENITFNTLLEDIDTETEKNSKPKIKLLQLNMGYIPIRESYKDFDLTNVQIMANQFNENINIQFKGKLNDNIFSWAGDLGTLNNFQQILFSNNLKEIPIKGNLSSDNYSAQIHGTVGGKNPSLKIKLNALKIDHQFSKIGFVEAHDIFYSGKIYLPFRVNIQSINHIRDEILHNLGAEGSINGKNLQFNQYNFNNFSGYFNWNNNQLKINNVQFINKQNHLNLDIAYNYNNDDQKLYVTIHPSVFPMEWLEQRYKLAELYSGPIEVTGNISAKGSNYDQWIHSMVGRVGIAGIGGIVKAEGLRHYLGKAADTLPLKKNLSTQCLAVHLNLKNDQLYFDTFTLQAKKFALNGTGYYSIPAHQIDFHIVPDISLGSFSASVPIIIKGNLDKPIINFEKNKDKVFTLSINTIKKMLERTDYCSDSLSKARAQ